MVTAKFYILNGGYAQEFWKIADLVKKSLIWLQQVLIRCTDGVPDDSELTKFQRQILQIAAQWEYSFEEYQYLSDTASLRLLDDLPNGGAENAPEKRYLFA